MILETFLDVAERMSHIFYPGALVRNPAAPHWGMGQVQSAIGHRITVNFRHAGKVTIDANRVDLIIVQEDDSTRQPRR